MYNRHVKEHAEKMFPKNVKCLTAHGMAFRKCGFAYSKKLTGNLKAIDIMDSGLMAEDESESRKKKVKSFQVILEVYKSFKLRMSFLAWRSGLHA